jgi:clan AA aspartic protease (TIGR02281 family)
MIVAHPAPTLNTFHEIIYNGIPRDMFARMPDDLQVFFKSEWESYTRTRSEIKWRLQLLMENELVKTMFSAPKTRFNIADAMDKGLCVVIDNSQAKLDEDGCRFLGRFFIARIWSAATARATRHDSQKKPVHVYIDECQLVLDEMIAKIIDECRSQKIGLVLAHQRITQIPDANVRGALANCAIKMVNIGGEDFDYFSNLFSIPRERLKLSRGHFATDVQFQGFSIVKVPYGKMPFRTMTPEEETALKVRMRDKYGVQSKDTPEPVVEAPKQKNHFSLQAVINGVNLSMILDTGAATTTLTHKTARLIGLRVATLDYSVKVSTANGTTLMALVLLDRISIGSITETQLAAFVTKDDGLDTDLLGMNFLDRLASWEVRDGRLILRGKDQEPHPQTRSDREPPSDPKPPLFPGTHKAPETESLLNDPSAPARWGQLKK